MDKSSCLSSEGDYCVCTIPLRCDIIQPSFLLSKWKLAWFRLSLCRFWLCWLHLSSLKKQRSLDGVQYQTLLHYRNNTADWFIFSSNVVYTLLSNESLKHVCLWSRSVRSMEGWWESSRGLWWRPVHTFGLSVLKSKTDTWWRKGSIACVLFLASVKCKASKCVLPPGASPRDLWKLLQGSSDLNGVRAHYLQ